MPEIHRKHRTSNDQLLGTKLVPPRLPVTLVSRPALLARLDESMATKLTLISAPAGYGKTTLAAQWLATRREPSAWVALDSGDDDPVRFWTYVITACQAFAPGFGKSALAALRTFHPPALEALLTPLINELAALPARGILTLEDYHVITSPKIHASVAFLLDHLPETLHLVVMTRSEPPIHLARLRAHNQVGEMNAADLQFSTEETHAFLEQILASAVQPETVALFDARTQGWAAGLRLMALALEGKREPLAFERLLASFSGGHRHVIEYLTAEVLAAQPEPLQEFLLQTSILSRLTASLCDAVTGRNDSDHVLAQLERANLFVLPLDDPAWYRYHPLFAEAMQLSARERFGEEGVLALYARASAWYEAHRLLDQAIETAIAGQQYPRAAALIERSLDLRSQHGLDTLRRWVERIPPEVLEAHPTLCFEYASALLFTLDRYAATTAAQMEPPLRVAEETWRREENSAGLGQVLALRSLVALWQGDLRRAFAQVRESLELLPEDDVFWRSSDLITVGIEESLAGRMETAQNVLFEARALSGAAQSTQGQLAATGLLADVYVRQGEFEQALELYQLVQKEAVGSEDMLDDQGTAALGLGMIAYERNDLDNAEREAARALELGTQRANEQLAVHAALSLARVLWARGKTGQAEEKLRALVAQTRPPLLVEEVLAYQARLALAVGDIETVHRWYAAVAQRAPELPPSLQEQQDLIEARMFIADEKPDAALELLERWRADAQQHGRTSSELETLALQVLAYSAQSKTPKASQALVRALTLAQSKGYERIFLDEGEPMRLLISAFRAQIEKQAPRLRAYVARLLAAFTNPITPAPKSKLPFEPLSPQEQRVLRLLVAGMSNPQIARELVVSTNTIKTQLQSIYRKLDVSNREQAREVAHALNLL